MGVLKEETRDLLEEVMQDKLTDLRLENDVNKSGYLVADVLKIAEIINKDYEMELEGQKLKPSWKKMLIEALKIVGPTIITMIGYDVFQRRVLYFEEHGRIASTAGRELHLPNFMKK